MQLLYLLVKKTLFQIQRDLRKLQQVLAAADYIVNRALQAQKLPTQIIGDMVREKIAASVTAQ